MYLENKIYQKILENLGLNDDSGVLGSDKLKKSICMLHNNYLLGSCKEAGIFIKKHPEKEIKDVFDFVMSIYNKRIKAHHSLFLVIHVFETAVRSKIALILSQNYSNEEQDDWFLKGKDQKLINKARHIADINKINLNLDMSSFEVLDLFTLGDLENLIDSKWSDFKDLFAQPKEYKDQRLPKYGTKEHLLKTFSMIRKAGNDIFHNNPTKIRPKSIVSNIEILLLRLGFNLNDALKNISNLEHSVTLKYKYG